MEKVLEKYVGGVLGVPTGVALPSHPRKAAHTADSVASPAGPRGPTRLSFSSSLPGAPDEGDEASIGSVDDETDGGPSFAMPRVEKLDKTLLLFIDDVSLPGSDKWGDWPTSEALRELLDTGKYHSSDRSSKCWEVRGLQLLAAAPHAGLRFGEGSWDSAPGAAGSEVDAMYHVPRIGPSAGACGLSQRVAAKFLLVHCPEPSQGSVMSWLFGPIVVPNVLLPSPVSTLLPGALLAAASNLVYTSLRTALIPALPSVPVPCFSLADLNRVKQVISLICIMHEFSCLSPSSLSTFRAGCICAGLGLHESATGGPHAHLAA